MKSKLAIVRTECLTYYRILLPIRLLGVQLEFFLVMDAVSQEEFVLKDVWLAKGRKMEHEVQRELLDDIQAKLDESEMKEVERHLFTPVKYCIVQIQVNGNAVNDETDELIMRKVDLSNAGKFSVMDSIHNIVNTRATKSNSKGITHRYHYRIVYEEHATPLYEVNRLSLVMMTLKDLVKGKVCLPPQSSNSTQFILVLNIFHRAGWVHRDISPGNVFLFQELVFKLGDLEFAKKIGKDGEHDVRTVRITFQAICATLTDDEGHSGFHVGRSGEAKIYVSSFPFESEILLP
jgi:serine/threonine protein kinase